MAWFSFRKKIQSNREYNLTFFPIFSELKPGELQLVEDKVRLLEIKKNEIVYSQGEPATAFYLILTGRFRIRRNEDEIINQLHPGDYFGETSILTGNPHSATVEAQNDSIVLKIEKNDFLALVKEIPPLSLNISRTLSHRLTSGFGREVLLGEAKILAFFHQVAQLGNSTLAIHFADSLVRETRKKVMLVDFSDLAQSKEARHNGSGIKKFELSEFGLSSPAKLAHYITKDWFSFHILKVVGELDCEKNVAHLLAYLLSEYQYILLDLPRTIDSLCRKTIQQADVIYFLAPEEDKETREVKLVIEEFKESYGFTEDHVRLVLRESQQKIISPFPKYAGSLERSAQTFAVIPTEEELKSRQAYLRNSFHELDRKRRFAKTVRFLTREVSGRAVGLALGSGAAFGYAHVGVLKVFEQEGIEIDLISASSIGAVIGGLWAAGLTTDRLTDILKTLDRRTTFFKLFGFSDLSAVHLGFFKGDQVVRFLKGYLNELTFRDLRIPLKVIATDLATGSPVLFEEGFVLDAIRASISIPGIFQPFLYQGKYLIDGGVADPLPIQILSRFGAKRIIAVNVLQSPDDHFNRLEILERKRQKAMEIVKEKGPLVRFFYEKRKKFSNKQSANIFNVLMKTIEFMEYGMSEAVSKQADIVLNPVVVDAHWAEFFSPDKFIRCGEKEARKNIEEIKKLVAE